MTFTIEEITLPAAVDAPDAGPFVDLMAVRNRVEADVLGTTSLSVSPREALPSFVSNEHRGRRHFVARVGGQVVARGLLGWPIGDGATQARITIDVLPEHRRQGIGTALLTLLQDEAVASGRTVLQADHPHRRLPGGPRVASPTGFGDVAADDDGVAFLLHHGWSLELVGRISSLDPTASASVAREGEHMAAQHVGPDYRVAQWAGLTPEDRLEDMAVLKSGMSTDAPMAGMVVDPDPWDVQRMRAFGQRQLASGRTLLTSAAEHVPSGRLVAYTEMEVVAADPPTAVQEDTLVLRDHRGHRLGMLVKAANLRQLLDVAPDTSVVTTFNAEDNRPMLDVNEALGFEAIGLEGSWQKRVPVAGE